MSKQWLAEFEKTHHISARAAYLAGRRDQVEADAKLLEARAAKSRDMESKVLADESEEHIWNMIAKYEQWAANAIRAQIKE